jgi:hypothetical protein
VLLCTGSTSRSKGLGQLGREGGGASVWLGPHAMAVSRLC